MEWNKTVITALKGKHLETLKGTVKRSYRLDYGVIAIKLASNLSLNRPICSNFYVFDFLTFLFVTLTSFDCILSLVLNKCLNGVIFRRY